MTAKLPAKLSIVLQVLHLTKIQSQYYEHIEEAEWHIEAVKEYMPGVPVCCTLAIGEDTDVHGVRSKP